jgi:hypothetical protein
MSAWPTDRPGTRIASFAYTRMKNPFATLFARILARLSVGKKLLLIYLLDLTAVIFISGILINEKYIAINFARDELRGNAYIAAARESLVDLGLVAAGMPAVPGTFAKHAGVLTEVENLHGRDMGSAEMNARLGTVLRKLEAGDATAPTINDALGRGRELITRVGNQSKLILDPDLDSYYTMSLTMLRYPELVEVVHGIGAELRADTRNGAMAASDARTR